MADTHISRGILVNVPGNISLALRVRLVTFQLPHFWDRSKIVVIWEPSCFSAMPMYKAPVHPSRSGYNGLREKSELDFGS